ncbi:MAG: uroporphyrinogen-III synthase [Nitrospirales bacterium]|nr:uroporphyrinogen-III synthase [Nitrospira sp.]MDR4500956.1 uroporphyrinogen-III synthase [Nitrospirales bacterium]
MNEKSGFDGLVVAAFESRMATEMTRLIERHGGKPLVAPSMQEIPLEENPRALAFGEQLLGEQFDLVILLTGVGTRSLVQVLQTKFSLDSIQEALGQTMLAARGPKSVTALKEINLTPKIVVPEPNTWRDVLESVRTFYPDGMQGLHIAVQEYGATNLELLEALRKQGATVTPVPVYRWAFPDDIEPLRGLLRNIIERKVDVILVTNAVQIEHAVKVLEETHEVDAFRQALKHMVVASIGYITSERLKQYGFAIDLEPTRAKMGILVKETSEQVQEILQQKRSSH